MRFLIGCLKGNNMHPVKYVWALRALFINYIIHILENLRILVNHCIWKEQKEYQ